MDTRRNDDYAGRIADLKQHRADLEAGTTTPRVPVAVAAAEIRELDRALTTLERLARG